MTTHSAENTHINSEFDDTNYFRVLGKLLMDSTNQKEIESQQVALLCKIPIDDIILWLSPEANPNYEVLADIICQSITAGSSINKPSSENYLKLSAAGFELEHLGQLVVKLITNEPEFLANEPLIFSKYLADPKSKWATEIRSKIIDSHGSDFSYEFITSYLGQKYRVILDAIPIPWHKLAIKKAALSVIYQYKLALSIKDIDNINRNYCTIENIATANEKSLTKAYHGLFNSNVDMDDFIRVNKITDHTRINYVKYLSVLNINNKNYEWAKKSLVSDIYKYHTDLVRQFLDYILIPGPQLSQCNITLPEKINYIKQRTQTKEYNPTEIAKFINRLFYVNTFYEARPPPYTFAEITSSLVEAGIHMPLLELINLPDCYVYEYIDWPEIRDVAKASNKVCIQIYNRYLRTLKSLDDWTPSIQMEYWNILSYSEYWFPQDRDKLVSILPVEILQDVPVKQIYSLRLYRHDGFHKLINDPADKNHKLKRDFAEIIKHELDELFSSKSAETNYKLKELALIVVRYYSEGLDILEYFQTGTRWLAEIVYESGTEYRNLSVDVLLGLITMTSNMQLINAFRAEIDRKLKLQAEDDKIKAFSGLFQIGDALAYPSSGVGGQTNLAQSVTRLAQAVATRPIKYWSENDYKYACAKGFITPEILHEFKRTQPIPHPDFNWKQLTIILGTDQTILAYPELPWRTPVYYPRDGNWVTRNIDWEYFKDRTMLFSSDSEIWTKFSTKLPIDFILQRPNYKFQWHSILTRPDFNPTLDQWLVIKPKLRKKDLQSHPNKYNIELIMDNLELGWDLQKLVSNRVIPLKYLPKLFNPKWFNKSILDSSYSKKPEVSITAALTNLKRKAILSAMAAEPDSLKYKCRLANYLFGDRPHIEKIVLGFATGFLSA